MAESLSAKNLIVSSGSKTIINNVSVELKKGELVCLCGPNGSGKSTLLTALAGIEATGLKIYAGEEGFLPEIKASDREETAGGEISTSTQNSIPGRQNSTSQKKSIPSQNSTSTQASISGTQNSIPLKKLPPKERAKKIAYMAQEESSMWDFTVFDIVLSGRFCYTKNGSYSDQDRLAAQEALSQLEILHLAQKSVFEISYGEFQKARIARTICQAADFMLLDEPTANLDFIYEPKLLEILHGESKKNKGVLIAIHNINLAARFADRIILLPPGQKEITGKPKDVFTNQNMKAVFSKEFEFKIIKKNNLVQVEI